LAGVHFPDAFDDLLNLYVSFDVVPLHTTPDFNIDVLDTRRISSAQAETNTVHKTRVTHVEGAGGCPHALFSTAGRTF
jgi:hypothetical protein